MCIQIISIYLSTFTSYEQGNVVCGSVVGNEPCMYMTICYLSFHGEKKYCHKLCCNCILLIAVAGGYLNIFSSKIFRSINSIIQPDFVRFCGYVQNVILQINMASCFVKFACIMVLKLNLKMIISLTRNNINDNGFCAVIGKPSLQNGKHQLFGPPQPSK